MNSTAKRLPLIGLIVTVALLLAACSGTGAAPEPAAATQPVDADSIVATVVAEIESRQPQPAATADVAALQATLLSAVEDRLAGLETGAVAQRAAVAAAMQAAGLEEDLVSVYRRANPAVVYVIVPPLGSGSGFVYSDEGYIVTNNHVVDSGRSFEVVFAGGERSTARLVGADPDSDLAVLQVDSLPDGLEPLSLAEAESLQVGQFVVAIGNPFGEQGSMSLGIVSGLGRSLRSQRGQTANTAYSLPSVIQTDAPINPGNSGGPLLNLEGQVVGVNSAIATDTGVNSGVGFSIPVIAVRQIVPSLIEQGRYAYAYMGAAFDDEISLSEQTQLGLPPTGGAYVVGVTPGGPAGRAGLIAADSGSGRGGDLIVQIDDTPIGDFSDLNSYLVFRTSVGQTIEMTVLRGGDEITLPLILGARP